MWLGLLQSSVPATSDCSPGPAAALLPPTTHRLLASGALLPVAPDEETPGSERRLFQQH